MCIIPYIIFTIINIVLYLGLINMRTSYKLEFKNYRKIRKDKEGKEYQFLISKLALIFLLFFIPSSALGTIIFTAIYFTMYDIYEAYIPLNYLKKPINKIIVFFEKIDKKFLR